MSGMPGLAGITTAPSGETSGTAPVYGNTASILSFKADITMGDGIPQENHCNQPVNDTIYLTIHPPGSACVTASLPAVARTATWDYRKGGQMQQ
jgi:hypothetical protein